MKSRIKSDERFSLRFWLWRMGNRCFRKNCTFHSNFLQLPAPKFHNTFHSNLWRQMKTTKTGPFQGNLYLMPNRVYAEESLHQIRHTLLYCIFWIAPLKAILQTMSLVIKGSPAQLKSKQQTTHRHTAKPNEYTYFLSGR